MDKTCVYMVELTYEIEEGGHHLNGRAPIAVYKDLDEAINQALTNADDDFTYEDVKEAFEVETDVTIWWHPMEIGDKFAKRVSVTIHELPYIG